jgi:ABC-type Fe3+-citrate transport system substrate-binding protein
VERIIATILVTAAVVAATPCLAYSDAEAKAFHIADKNGDKQIDRREFRVLINEMAAIGAEKAISVKKWGVYGIGFKRADANGDGVISIPELKAQK